jgi:alpha-ketoglutarate-dependent taurine dioxygenase
MSQSDLSKLKRPGAVARRGIVVSQQDLVTVGTLLPGQALPVVIRPSVEGVNLIEWAASNRTTIEDHLRREGGILFRGFGRRSVEEFEHFTATTTSELLEYSNRSTPRSHVGNKIYTSTEYPADQWIPMHNEMSYTRSWPMKIWFCCMISAAQGGETPIADSRRVFEKIDPAIRQRFADKQVMYVRNYGDGLDLNWQEVFQTDSPAEVEMFCRQAGMEFAWKAGNRLRTRQVCQAVAAHPQTGEMVWFNQAHLFHISALAPEVQATLHAMFGEEGLPRNTYYGDGTPIEAEMLDAIRAVYAQEMVLFRWEEGDVLMLDNMLVAHGRAPFSGPRKILVGMAEAMTLPDEATAPIAG